MQSQIKRITDILRKDDGIDGVMHYTQQISWILFLKFLDDYETSQVLEAQLNGKKYTRLLTPEFQRDTWAVPKKKDGSRDMNHAMSGDDLKEFVESKLFPYLKSFKSENIDYHSMKYKIGEIFSFTENKIESGHTMREIFDIVDDLSFQSQSDIFELSQIYEGILFNLGSGGKNSGEYYTPRAVIRAMVECVDPKVGETIYDGAAGSCGFLIEAFEFLKKKIKKTDDLHRLHYDALWGNEKTGIGYMMGVMNMILHGIENPNINKKNTLTDNIRDFQEKDRYHIILANPPFGGNEKEDIQSNFPVKSNATELLFLQHFKKKMKTGGRAAIIIPEGVLFNTGNAFQEVKKQLLEDFNLHTIVSLPAGVFLPYSGVKTNIMFFDKTKATEKIWYYEVDPGRKLTKNKPITAEDMADMVACFKTQKTGDNSWFVQVKDLKDYDLSAKNPVKNKEIIHEAPSVILEKIKKGAKKIETGLDLLSQLLQN